MSSTDFIPTGQGAFIRTISEECPEGGRSRCVSWRDPSGKDHSIEYIEQDKASKETLSVYDICVKDKILSFSEQDLGEVAPDIDVWGKVKILSDIISVAKEESLPEKRVGRAASSATTIERSTAKEKAVLEERVRKLLPDHPELIPKLVDVFEEALDEIQKQKPEERLREPTKVKKRIPVVDEKGKPLVSKKGKPLTDIEGKPITIRIKLREGKLYAEIRGLSFGTGGSKKVEDVRALALTRIPRDDYADTRYAYAKLKDVGKKTTSEKQWVKDALKEFNQERAMYALLERKNVPCAARRMRKFQSEKNYAIRLVPYPEGSVTQLLKINPPEGGWKGRDLIDRLILLCDMAAFVEGLHSLGYVYNDLKLDNALFSGTGAAARTRLVITDFGTIYQS